MQPVNEKPKFTMISTVETRPLPKIVITKDAMRWIDAIVDIHPLEVGWYGVVDVMQDGSYLVRDILYPKHSAMESATCEISPEGEAEMLDLLFKEGREDDIPKAKVFWGHSHHNMTTSPSQQDENQAMSIMKQNKNLCIRAICNKRGEMNLTVFDYKQSVKFENVPFSVEEESEEVARIRIQNIKSIIDSDLPEVEKSKAILEASQEDLEKDEVEKVRKWVSDLKEENTPKKEYPVNKVYNAHNHFKKNRKKGRYQENLFPGHHYKEDDIMYNNEMDDVLRDYDLYNREGGF